MTGNPIRVLIPFNTVSLYGMERGVIETFDLLRPDTTSHFLMSYTTKRLNLPVLAEVKKRDLAHSFFSDKTDWPKIGRPKSLRESWHMTLAMIRGNIDVLRAARGKNAIYLPSVSYFYFAIVAAIVHRMLRRRIIYHFHDLVVRKSWALRLTSLFVTDFVHNTQFGYDQVVRLHPYIRGTRSWIIPLAINPRPVEGVTGNQRRNKERNVLFVGQVTKHKGVELLLDAFNRVTKLRAENVTLHLIGGCDDPLLMDKLKHEAIINGSKIKCWGYQSNIIEFLKLADVLVQPSPSTTNESFGRVVVEAMSVGVPAVCFRSGALQELVRHEQTGLICEEESAECLARNVERFLDDEELRARCGALARHRFEEYYSALRVKSLWLRALEADRTN